MTETDRSPSSPSWRAAVEAAAEKSYDCLGSPNYCWEDMSPGERDEWRAAARAALESAAPLLLQAVVAEIGDTSMESLSDHLGMMVATSPDVGHMAERGRRRLHGVLDAALSRLLSISSSGGPAAR